MKAHLKAMEHRSLAVWDRTVLPATQHKWTHHHLNPSQTGRYSIYLSRRDGRL